MQPHNLSYRCILNHIYLYYIYSFIIVASNNYIVQNNNFTPSPPWDLYITLNFNIIINSVWCDNKWQYLRRLYK